MKPNSFCPTDIIIPQTASQYSRTARLYALRSDIFLSQTASCPDILAQPSFSELTVMSGSAFQRCPELQVHIHVWTLCSDNQANEAEYGMVLRCNWNKALRHWRQRRDLDFAPVNVDAVFVILSGDKHKSAYSVTFWNLTLCQ